jgi:hypothetical protein
MPLHPRLREGILAEQQDMVELDALQLIPALGQGPNQGLGYSGVAAVVDAVAATDLLDRLGRPVP